jgi:hypothetical protein
MANTLQWRGWDELDDHFVLELGFDFNMIKFRGCPTQRPPRDPGTGDMISGGHRPAQKNPETMV